MRHLRSDFDCIQPWPTKRAHVARHNGRVATFTDEFLERVDIIHDAEAPFQPVIPDDEPVFLVRAKDPSASAAVRAWCRDAEQRGADAELIARTREFADEMDAYASERYGDDRKPADVPKGALR